MGRLANLLWGSGPQPAQRAEADLYTFTPRTGDIAQSANLPVSVAQAFGINLSGDSISRKEAMTIPAVRRGRNVIAGTLGAAPLIAVRQRAGQPPERVPRTLLSQPDPNVTCAFTVTWTLDDLIFYGVSWWLVTKRDSFGYPANAERIHPIRIRVDMAQQQAYVDGKPVNDRDLIRFDGPDEGILTYGATTLKTYLLLENAVRNYARMDVPLGLIQDEEGAMTTDEVQTFLDSWEAARIKRSTGYLPSGLKYVNPAFNAEQLELSTARDFQSQEIARLMNLPASSINAPVNSSLTYATTESNRRELVDMTLQPFKVAIEQRLSMPDVTPGGTTVQFDLGMFLRGDIKSVIETGAAAVGAGLMTKDEVRTEWLGLPPLEGTNNGAGDA